MAEEKSNRRSVVIPIVPSPAGATISQTNASIDTSLTGMLNSAMSPASDTPVPWRFGRYQIEKELGKGAMGVVYLAEDTQLGRKVALKIPKKSSLEDPESLERFYREAKTTSLLRHNNICPVYDVGQIDGVHYLTMAYIPGKPVSSFVTKGKYPPARQVALLIRKIALALEEAHQNGVVHRDLKPANVMLDNRGEPIVMDFGLARNSNTAENARLTQSGEILGTPAYMAPEQVRGEVDAIGPACDIYALGVMMYQFLTGELPFNGPIMMVFAQILTNQPQRPSELRPDVDPALEAICVKMMAKDAGDRFGSMKEVAAALTDYLKRGSVGGSGTMSTVAPVAAVDLPEPKLEAFTAQPSLESIKREPRQEMPAKPQANSQANAWGRIRRKPWPSPAAVGLGALAAFVLFAVIYVQLGAATVKIETDEPNLKVIYNGREITLKLPQEEPIKVRPGKHTLKVDRGSLGFETKEFELKRGEDKRLVVTLVDEKIQLVPKAEHIPKQKAATSPSAPPPEVAKVLFPVGATYSGIWNAYPPGSDVVNGRWRFRLKITHRENVAVEAELVLFATEERWILKGRLVEEDGRQPSLAIEEIELVDGEHPLEGTTAIDFDTENEQMALRGSARSTTGWRAEIEGSLVEPPSDSPESGADAKLSRREFATIGGQWYIDGEELVQSDSNKEFAYLLFGDHSWTDYDFTVDLMRTQGRLSAALLFRHEAPSFYLYAVGHGAQSLAEIHTAERDDQNKFRWLSVAKQEAPISDHTWYTASVSVRGNHIQCRLWNGSENMTLFDFTDDRFPRGRVGLRCVKSGYRFKNIKVTSPDGTVLWDGLPMLAQ